MFKNISKKCLIIFQKNSKKFKNISKFSKKIQKNFEKFQKNISKKCKNNISKKRRRYCVNYTYDSSVLFSGSLSYYIVSDLKNVYYLNNPYVYVTYFKCIYNSFFLNVCNIYMLPLQFKNFI